MKHSFRLSKQAEADIEVIANYIWQDKPKSAIEFTQEVEQICQLLSSMPKMGKRVEFIDSPEYFVFPAGKFGNYLIFYLLEQEIPQIIRVLHRRRDIENLFDEE